MLWRIPAAIRILQSLTEKPKYLSDLSQELDIPASSLSRHIDALAEARLIRVSYRPGPKGHMKCCSQALAGYGVRLAGRPRGGGREQRIFGGNAHRNVYPMQHFRPLRHDRTGGKHRGIR